MGWLSITENICEAEHHLLLSEIQTFHTDAFIKICQFYTKIVCFRMTHLNEHSFNQFKVCT